MSVLRLTDGQLAFGEQIILDHAELLIEAGEKVCLVGRNGTGKSTLLKAIDAEIQLDGGQLQRIGNAVVTRLPQDPPANSSATVYDFVAAGLSEIGATLQAFHQCANKLAQQGDDTQLLSQFERLQSQLDAQDGWRFNARIEAILTRLELAPDETLANLSGGWLRRVALAKALVVEPDLLLLDEPTNHLDIEMVKWLEQTVKEFRGAVLFISHDRTFIRNVASRIIDLDRGILTSFPGDYDKYLEKKQELLDIEVNQQAEFDKKLAQEETWIRQGIKARRTRNEGRVRALQALRRERQARREQQGSVKLSVNEAARSGKLVFEGQQLQLSFAQKAILTDFNFTMQRGDKVALVGPNGCGKSTLIRVLLGQQAVDAGQIKLGTNLEVAYFDQHRAALDVNATVADNVGEGKQDVTYQGKSKHILSYLQDFLFTPKQARTPVRALSGGERNRALLAKIFLKPSNFLILDEPTNDLDIDTLELLEQLIADYQGSVVMVSHDREFINNTASSILLFEGAGVVTEIFGGFTEVQHYLHAQQSGADTVQKGTNAAATQSQQTLSKTAAVNSSGGQRNQKKLSYKLQRELDGLPAQIEALELEQQRLNEQAAAPDFYQQAITVTQPVLERLSAIEEELLQALERWEALEQLQQESSN